MKRILKYFSLGLLSTFLTATPGLTAERISFFYPPFGEFSLPVDSLETFAKEGRIDRNFQFYAQRATPEQLAQLRELLQIRFNVTPTLVSQVTYSPVGEEVLQRLGEFLLTDSRRNGFYALRGALILSAASEEGLTLVNVLRKFPSNDVRLNFTEAMQIVDELSQLLRTKDKVVSYLQKQALTESLTSQVDFSKLPDLRQRGNFRWQLTRFNLNDVRRNRLLPLDLYLPTTSKENDTHSPFPLIVISHGVASDRYTFAYLAQHLASYGFAVAVLEHPGSNARRFQQYFAGLAKPPAPREFIDRPLDIQFLLDELQLMAQSDPNLKGKLNFEKIGAIGQSLGGYTILASAGAEMNFEQLQQNCLPDNSNLNLSLVLQCQMALLSSENYELKDERIKVIIAINPINSAIFDDNGISQIKVPVMLITGSQDIFAPALPEQIRPFTWLPNPHKYLVLVENATHFTFIGESPNQSNVLPVPKGLLGPERTVAFSYLNALSVAFLEANLLNRSESRVYLQPSYAQYISKYPLNLSLLQSLTTEQLNEAMK